MRKCVIVRKAPLWAVLGLGLLAAPLASAESPGAAPTGDAPTSLGKLPDFAALDRDGDHQLSKSEAQAHPRLNANFNDVDADKDGSVSRAEFSAFEKQMQVPAEE